MTWKNNKSADLLEKNSRTITGGVVSINRRIDPAVCFARGEGCRVWDEDGNEYIDYHAGFAPVLLGHNHPRVNDAVRQMLDRGAVHMGSGTTWYEGRLAELLVEHIPAIMDLFVDPDPARRVLIAGTYNAHPLPTAAAIATIEILAENDGQVYRHTDAMGARLERGLADVFAEKGIAAATARQGSAFCTYFMDHEPRDWHDLAENHDADLDGRYRQALLRNGVYHFPMVTKQGSISLAHGERDIDETLEITRKGVAKL